MHPDPTFRQDDRALLETLIAQIGFGLVFATLPDGPRVAHTPLLSVGKGAVQFHLSRGNALTPHLAGMTALAVVNGPSGYVSARWYADSAQVPTWNYVALELEGRVRRLESEATLALLEQLSARHEAEIEHGTPWTMAKLPEARRRSLLAGIIGFELDVLAWRPTFKLSQNKPPEEIARLIAGLEEQGSTAIAALMRRFAA